VLYQYAGRETHTTTIKLEAKNADIPFYGLADLLELLGTLMMKLEGLSSGSGSASFLLPHPDPRPQTLLILKNSV
jgi:hypothetical protein